MSTKTKVRYSGRIAEIHQDGENFLTTLRNILYIPKLNENDLLLMEEARKNLERVQENLTAIEKRMQQILNFALKEYGIKEKWALSIKKDYHVFRTVFTTGFIGFTLDIPNKSKWKTEFRRCPIFTLMPMDMPTKWLDLTPSQLKAEFHKL